MKKLSLSPLDPWPGGVCMGYWKLNSWTENDHFSMPFINQMLDRLAGKGWYCFLMGISGITESPLHRRFKRKQLLHALMEHLTSSECLLGYVMLRQPFKCMLSIFAYMVENSMEVFMNDFSVIGDSFEEWLKHLEMVLKRCVDLTLVLNWKKCHFMVK